MKKLTKILAALVLAAASLVMSGCSDEVTEVLAGPTNTWCRMPVSYKNTNSDANSSELYAYFYYATSNKTIGKAELKKGLNVVVTTKGSDTLFGSLTSSLYILKSFDEDKTTDISESSSDAEVFKFVGSRAKWSAIYWAKEDLQKNKGIEPSQIKTTTPLTDLSKLENFSLKRLLANYLLSVLEG
ncbi:MAG: hypothetical protein KBT11_02870 [Treponema sp.]|nr:hypothetical protein [Candidatus Treponema equifaecale]